ncbi:MAG: UDP-N-acetylmuramoyl-L-alanyl-D-glutamate--2,6-diaminopimelate ligase [Bacillota bacterium]
MHLSEIIEAVRPVSIYGGECQEISNITNNSNDVKPNALFICISGYRGDGHLYANEAVKRGAVAVITERKLDLPVSQIVVTNSRLAQALASHKFFGYPSSKLKLVGITGTNGKTTISYMTEAILRAAGFNTGLIGTIKYKINKNIMPARLTTPDSPELGYLFRQMLVNKVEFAVMEVSSHALDQHRVTGCDFDVVVFSNIARDHFDFHHNFQNYLKAKTRLFANQCSWGSKPLMHRCAVINTDDQYSSYIIKATEAAKIYSYGFNPSARVRAVGYMLDINSSVVEVKVDDRPFTIKLALPGLFNISNALAAIAVGLCFGIDLDIIKQALSDFEGIPGRCEFINCDQNFNVMVDFAHNPSGLFNILTGIPYPNSTHKKIVVFGCEGGKDQGKRSLMGIIAARHADYCIISTDNVYREDPEDIVRDIEQGLIQGGISPSRYRIILDRYEAIRHSLEIARPGDIVIIAGKGHENEQVINNQVIPFDDRVVIKQILAT